MPNTIETQIRDRISAFVSELDALVRKSTLEALRGVLEKTPPSGQRGRGRPRGSGGARAPVGGDSTDAILAFLRANDGQGVREIAAGTGLSSSVAKQAVAQLLASGALAKSGQRRGTKYHVGSGKRVAPRAKRKRKGGRRKRAR
jgi:hypothetical protein